MEKIFGIDLGTTNSEIAYFKDGKPEVIPIENGIKYMPSVVGIDASGAMVTGVKARNQYAAFPENTVASIKRMMGSGKTVTMAGKEYTPARVSAEILKALKQAAERETGLPVEKAVITVPAYFADAQRKETIQAGEMAGLEVVRIINEPTAAALAYGCLEDRKQRERILVYDLGGGTFDISLIDVEEGVTEVLASDGNSRLGGDDFDRLLEKYFRSFLPAALRRQNDLKLDARLKRLAEDVKIKLSRESRLEVKEEFIANVEGKPFHLETGISREAFEALIAGKLDETVTLLDNVIKQGGIAKENINRILLVGGSTYIPAILDMLSTELGFDVHREVDPTYCVVLGAAIQGAIISGEEVEAILVDVNSHSLGIRCREGGLLGEENDDYFSILIHRNTPVPAAMTKNHYTIMPNQKTVKITAYQGENPTASSNTLLGSFQLGNLPPKLPAGSEIQVTFEYNLNGMVEITAHEPTGSSREQLTVDVNRRPDGQGDKPRETREMLQEPGEETAPAGDKGQKMSLRKIERILKRAGKIRKTVDHPSTLAELDKKIADLEKTLETNDRNTERLAGELAGFIAGL